MREDAAELVDEEHGEHGKHDEHGKQHKDGGHEEHHEAEKSNEQLDKQLAIKMKKRDVLKATYLAEFSGFAMLWVNDIPMTVINAIYLANNNGRVPKFVLGNFCVNCILLGYELRGVGELREMKKKLVKQKSHISIQMSHIRLSRPNTMPLTLKSSTLSTLRHGESSSRGNRSSLTENSAVDKHSSSDHHEGGNRHSVVEPIAEHADEHVEHAERADEHGAAGDHTEHHAAPSDASINPISSDIVLESGELQ